MRNPQTKIVEPLAWAFPPEPVACEIRSRAAQRPHAGAGETTATRPPLLFVHGLGHGAWSWDEHWLPAAAERGWPCHAVSLRGHGDSGGVRGRRWKLRDYEHDVMQAIIALPAPPVLIGHSMGALVVRRVLARYPARAGVLVTPPGARHGLGSAVLLARHNPRQLVRATAGRSLRLGPHDLFARLDAAGARAYCDRQVDESPWAQYELLLAPRPRASRAPVLVLGAGADRLVTLHDTISTARAYGTRPHVFRGMGHDLMLDRGWQEPLDVMLDWLDRTLTDDVGERA